MASLISPKMAAEYVESPENEPEIKNKATVAALYEAMASGETGKVAGLLASDLEYWFHGPQSSNHMMRMLTGEAPHSDFKFEPRSITTIDDRVIAEGYEGAKVYWVHVWNLKGGLITQFREYFNTWLTIKELKPTGWDRWMVQPHAGSTLWQSQPRDLFRRSLPGLMLAI